MSTLITADIHLNTKPADEHRWGIFDWLAAQVTKSKLAEVCILGDMTDAKDRHTSRLVNRLVTGISRVALVCEVYWLKGNHDYVDPSCPYFGFISSIQNVHFISEPTIAKLSIGQVLFLPATSDYKKDWSVVVDEDIRLADYVFTHATFDGVRSESGYTLEGIPPSYFKGYAGQVWSGDIHVPQKIGKVIEYVGAPYRVRFGDTFEPRCILLDKGGWRSALRFPCKSKHVVTIREFGELESAPRIQRIKRGDQVKVRVQLARDEYVIWQKLRLSIIEFAQKQGWELTGPIPETLGVKTKTAAEVNSGKIDPKKVLANYISAKKVSASAAKLGRKLLEDAL